MPYINILITTALSTLPLVEGRFGFAIGYKLLELPVLTSFIAAIIGSFASIILLTFLLYDLYDNWANNPIQRFINHFVEKIKSRHSHRLEQIAFLSLILFIAIPLPLSGSYSGIVIAYLIKLPKKQALMAGFIGSLLSLTIVLLTIESIDLSSKFFYELLR